MRRDSSRFGIVMGLALAGAMMGGGREARAGSGDGITITGTKPTPISDSLYEYTFNLYLNTPTSYIQEGDSFAIYGFGSAAAIQVDSAAPNAPSSWTAASSGGDSISWTYEAATDITYPGSSGTPVGPSFQIIVSFDTSTPATFLNYSYDIDGGSVLGSSDPNSPNYNAGSPPINLASVPEPSSAVMILIAWGSGAVVGLVARRRRRRAAAARPEPVGAPAGRAVNDPGRSGR